MRHCMQASWRPRMMRRQRSYHPHRCSTPGLTMRPQQALECRGMVWGCSLQQLTQLVPAGVASQRSLLNYYPLQGQALQPPEEQQQQQQQRMGRKCRMGLRGQAAWHCRCPCKLHPPHHHQPPPTPPALPPCAPPLVRPLAPPASPSHAPQATMTTTAAAHQAGVFPCPSPTPSPL